MAHTTINKPSAYFNNKLYAGNSGSQSITGVGHKPDLVWVKQRNGSAYHQLTDIIRGVNSQAASNATGLGASNTCLTAFNSDGFALGSNGDVNGNNLTYVSWNWKGNGAGSSNSDGTITSTVSANATSGFSIVKYNGTSTVGATVGHGLGKIPKMLIVKNILAGEAWQVYHSALGNAQALNLNTTGVSASSTSWNSTSPDINKFTIYSSGQIGQTGGTYVAYCFADVKGFSKMSSYTGNGNADGTFVYTGFKPACIILKQYNTNGSNWFLFDNKRVGFNIENYYIAPDTSGTEGTTDKLDMLSNGFKIKTSNSDVNGGDFIYMAWAETPFVANSGESIPTTAR